MHTVAVYHLDHDIQVVIFCEIRHNLCVKSSWNLQLLIKFVHFHDFLACICFEPFAH